MTQTHRYASSFVAALCLLCAFVCVGLYADACRADEADFPQPVSLNPAVNFWVKVYTQADTESGFLHDPDNLDIVYEKLPRDLTLIDQHRKQIVRDLKFLATGARTNLSDSQQHILDLWGKDVSNERLKQAADNVRWQLGQSDRYQEGLTRAGAYQPHIRAVARSLGMPEELASLPHVESSFHPGASSNVAATGMFQFMRETARRFMRVDNLVDERLDPYKSAFGAMKLLKENYDELGTWPLALTAYNHGTNGMVHAVQVTGTTDIGRIIEQYKGSRFGFASRNFYAEFLAAREVEKNADKYFGGVDKQSAPQFAEFEMTGFVDARVLARNLGVSIDALKQDNPALLKPVWSGNKRIPKGYIVKLDKSHLEASPEVAIRNISPDDLHSAQTIDETHTVAKGDTLSKIASQYKTSVAELIAINQLGNRHAIKIGQKLILPQPNGAVPTLVVNRNEQETSKSGHYIVLKGDTLSTIASRFKVPEKTLLALNDLQDANSLQPGQQLLLKAETAKPAPPPTVATDIDRAVVGGSAPTTIPEQAMAVASMVHSMNAADYAVADDNTIEVLPEETVGHYADWLRVQSKDLYKLNKLKEGKNVKIGARLKLDFTKVDREKFETRRRQFHSNLQTQYFAIWRISDTANYQLKGNDSLGQLVRTNDIPLWLFRQYNPGIDPAHVQAGQTVVIPKVERVGGVSR
ncbi:MAG TPA: LysM peptidoglycan-binding domain-containing protein [Candidatus Acidoferrum sp.]|nr:LysM peptidoglycan-binding domain-containing protein [Candidatus Acidoferrum sp.]